MGKRDLVALLYLSSWCLVIVVLLFLAMPLVCLQFVIVVFPDHTHYSWCKWVDLSELLPHANAIIYQYQNLVCWPIITYVTWRC